jgi:hypothetical protein
MIVEVPEAPVEAPAELSVEDRIAAKFGGLPQEAAEPAEVAAEPDLFELEMDGAKYSLPSKLKDSFMRNEDYTRKTSELAEQRRALDQSKEIMTRAQIESAFEQSVSTEQREIALRDAYLGRASKLDWSSMTTDQMLRQKHEIDVIREERDNLKAEIEGKRAKFSDDMKSKFSELRTRSRELAAKSIPGFTEETEKSIRSHAMTHGLSEQEIDNVLLDPRSAKILWEASQFAKVKAGTQNAVATTTKVVKPGASNERMPQAVVDKLNYRKAISKAVTSGDKARLIEGRLEGLFNRGIR